MIILMNKSTVKKFVRISLVTLEVITFGEAGSEIALAEIIIEHI